MDHKVEMNTLQKTFKKLHFKKCRPWKFQKLKKYIKKFQTLEATG